MPKALKINESEKVRALFRQREVLTQKLQNEVTEVDRKNLAKKLEAFNFEIVEQIYLEIDNCNIETLTKLFGIKNKYTTLSMFLNDEFIQILLEINHVEKILSIEIPSSYKEFLDENHSAFHALSNAK